MGSGKPELYCFSIGVRVRLMTLFGVFLGPREGVYIMYERSLLVQYDSCEIEHLSWRVL